MVAKPNTARSNDAAKPSDLPQPSDTAQSKERWSALIIGFILIIAFAHLFPLLRIRVEGLVENRVLAQRPEFPKHLSEWKGLTDRWDAYLTDNFAPRAFIISRLNYARYLMGYSGSEKVVVGRDGWLFFDSDTHLSQFAGKLSLSDPEIAGWVAAFKERVAYLNGMGIQFYMLIGPVKEDMYPEHRPSWMPTIRVDNEVDKIVRAMSQAGVDRLVDPRPELLAAKSIYPLWDEYETHWSGWGAYIGYKALVNRIAQDIPDVKAYPQSYFDGIQHSSPSTVENLGTMLGIAGFTDQDRMTYELADWAGQAKTTYLTDKHDWTAPLVINTPSKNGRTLLLMRDSFSTEMLPLLEANFSRIIAVHVQDGFFRDDLIKKYHPDAVVLEIIESGTRFTMDPLQSAISAIHDPIR